MDGEFHFCRKCGYQNPRKNNFCARCGEAMRTVADIMGKNQPEAGAKKNPENNTPKEKSPPAECPNCGSPINGADFCNKCGLPLMSGITVQDQGDMAVIVIGVEQFDFETHALLRPVYKSVLRKKIVVDVTGVRWMDSTGIGALVSLAYMAPRNHQEIKFIGLNDNIKAAVKSLQVDNVLEVAGDINACRVDWGLPPV